MPKHFQWILTCVDDGSSYTLTNDPIGFDECSFRMERHSTYHGIFNQFTSNLKFHNDGGGKQFIDAKYQLFDINGQINIEVLVDSDGTGTIYDTLFTGKLNLASYQEDGIHTTVNIEQSDLATKLNTRADIPVPINVPTVTVPGQPMFNAVAMDTYPQSTGTSGTFIFEDPQILKGKVFKVVTTDVNNNNVADSLNYTGDHQSGTGGSSGPTTVQIADVVDGALTITFANIYSDIILYAVGAQLSLGQQVIQPVQTKSIALNGIPIQYESLFSMADDVNSDSFTFSQGNNGWGGGQNINNGDLISAVIYDILGNPVYDQVMYNGLSIAGPGMTSADGLTKIQITGITSTTVTVTFINANGNIDLFLGSIGMVGSPGAGIGTPPGTSLATYTPTGSIPAQDFAIPFSGTMSISDGDVVGGFINFDSNTVFDNLNEIVFGRYNDINIAPGNKTTSNTILPAICAGVNRPYIKYPVIVNYKIQLKGSFTENLGTSIERDILTSFVLTHGGGQAPSGTNPLSLATDINLATNGNVDVTTNSYTWDFAINASGSFTLNAGDQIWFYFFLQEQFLGGPLTGFSIPLTFNFTQSVFDFNITEIAIPTSASAIMIHEAFNQVTDMIADTDGNFYSEFYGSTNSQKLTYAQDGEGSKRVITNGLCIRGRQDKYISLSLNDLFNSMAAIDNIGMEINSNNRLRVEKLNFFFDPITQIASLPNVYTFTTVNENSLYYNQIEVGYDKWETELYFKNGLDEVHAKRYFATRVAAAKGTVLQKYGSDVRSLLAVSNKLSKVCGLIAGNYAIELTRRKNYEWSHDDFKYDNDNFIICVRDSVTTSADFLTTNAVLLTGSYPNIQPGDSIIIGGTISNNGSFIVTSAVVSDSNQTLLELSNTVTDETAANCTITDLTHAFTETASDILAQPIGNVINPDLSQGWLNMSITPARMLQSNMNHITAGLQKIRGNIQFLNGEGNFLATTKFIDDRTIRQQDYNFYTLGENTSLSYGDGNVRNIDPLWLPEIYRFEYPLTYQQFKAIRTNPNGYISFYKFADQVKKGFILSMEYSLKTGLTKFELLKVYDPDILLQEAEDATLVADEAEQVIQTLELRT